MKWTSEIEQPYYHCDMRIHFVTLANISIIFKNQISHNSSTCNSYVALMFKITDQFHISLLKNKFVQSKQYKQIFLKNIHNSYIHIAMFVFLSIWTLLETDINWTRRWCLHAWTCLFDKSLVQPFQNYSKRCKSLTNWYKKHWL